MLQSVRGTLGALPWKATIAGLAVIAVVTVVGWRLLDRGPYEVTLLMPAADGTFEGARVNINGTQVGTVQDIGVRDGLAAVTVSVDDDHAPLPAGTTGRVKWESVLGARIIELTPGKEGNAELPSGHVLADNPEAVEVDDLLAMLDEPTRKQLQGLVQQLEGALGGKEQDLNTTLKEAGPTFKALGEVARSIGEDGPAIKAIVTQLNGVAQKVAGRDGELSSSVTQLNRLLSALAGEQADLSAMLDQLPGTLDQATATLDNVEGPVGSTRTLLRELKPSTARLPGIAQDLRPVLSSAKPAIADLPPLLRDADALLKQTPALLTAANDLLPDLDDTLEQVNPMVAFLRPYTPEAVGWLSNWTSLFASENGSGNYARALITASGSSLDDVQPGVPPGQAQDARPAPGSLAKQPWTDANGDELN